MEKYHCVTSEQLFYIDEYCPELERLNKVRLCFAYV